MNENEFEMETTISDDIGNEARPQVLTHYVGPETTERTMTGIMQEMMQGVEQSRHRSILGSVDMLRRMGCDDAEIRKQLLQGYSLTPEEADEALSSAR